MGYWLMYHQSKELQLKFFTVCKEQQVLQAKVFAWRFFQMEGDLCIAGGQRTHHTV